MKSRKKYTKNCYYADDPRAIKELEKVKRRLQDLDDEGKEMHHEDNRDQNIILMWKRGASIKGIASKYRMKASNIRSIIGLALYED